MTTDSGATAYSGGRSDVTQQSLGELVSNISETTTRLLRQEVALAKAETKQELVVAGRGVGMLAGAGALGLVALIMLSMALVDWLSDAMDPGWAYLLVFALWVVVAAVLASAGRKALKQVNPVPERTAETLREIPEAVRGRS
ncbi:MAG TPA: phage holin family protein [Candidatus Nanopelagicales bacterium]